MWPCIRAANLQLELHTHGPWPLLKKFRRNIDYNTYHCTEVPPILQFNYRCAFFLVTNCKIFCAKKQNKNKKWTFFKGHKSVHKVLTFFWVNSTKHYIRWSLKVTFLWNSFPWEQNRSSANAIYFFLSRIWIWKINVHHEKLCTIEEIFKQKATTSYQKTLKTSSIVISCFRGS